MNRQTARILCHMGQRHWPAGALLWQARKQAAKKNKKDNTAKGRTR